MYSLYLRYIISHIVNNNAKSAIFSPKVSMITTNVILILCNSSINNKLILRDLRFRRHISCFCSFSNKNNSKHSHSTVLCLSNMTVIRSWMNQPFKWFGSIAMTHLLTLTYCHLLAVLITHLKYLHFLKIISNISFQRFMFQISKHYLCICNCRLAFCVLLSCIKVCVNTSKCLFICIAKIHFFYTDFICLVTAQMQEFDSKDDAHF